MVYEKRIATLQRMLDAINGPDANYNLLRTIEEDLPNPPRYHIWNVIGALLYERLQGHVWEGGVVADRLRRRIEKCREYMLIS